MNEKQIELVVFPSGSKVELPLLPYICGDCRTQQDADGICANCGSSNLVFQRDSPFVDSEVHL